MGGGDSLVAEGGDSLESGRGDSLVIGGGVSLGGRDSDFADGGDSLVTTGGDFLGGGDSFMMEGGEFCSPNSGGGDCFLTGGGESNERGDESLGGSLGSILLVCDEGFIVLNISSSSLSSKGSFIFSFALVSSLFVVELPPINKGSSATSFLSIFTALKSPSSLTEGMEALADADGLPIEDLEPNRSPSSSSSLTENGSDMAGTRAVGFCTIVVVVGGLLSIASD